MGLVLQWRRPNFLLALKQFEKLKLKTIYGEIRRRCSFMPSIYRVKVAALVALLLCLSTVRGTAAFESKAESRATQKVATAINKITTAVENGQILTTIEANGLLADKTFAAPPAAPPDNTGLVAGAGSAAKEEPKSEEVAKADPKKETATEGRAPASVPSVKGPAPRPSMVRSAAAAARPAVPAPAD